MPINLWEKGKLKEDEVGGIVGLCYFILVKMVEYSHFSMVQANSFFIFVFLNGQREHPNIFFLFEIAGPDAAFPKKKN